MLETTHALVAGAIARHTGDPILAVSLSYLSHFLLDAVPHWDFGTNWRDRRKLYTGLIATADVMVGFGAAFLIFGTSVPLPLLCASVTASMIPDWMEAPWYIFFADHAKKQPGKSAGFLEKLTYGVYKMENTFHNKTAFPLGVITQLVAVAFFFYLLK